MDTVLKKQNASMDKDWLRLLATRHHDPHALLGRHVLGEHAVLRVYRPDLCAVFLKLRTGLVPLTQGDAPGLFTWEGKAADLPEHPELSFSDKKGERYSFIDPYSFSPMLSVVELQQFNSSLCWNAYRLFGSHLCTRNEIAGTRFAVWAPNAERVSVVGDFNQWDGRLHMMKNRGQSGVWELFIPGLQAGHLYKYEIRHRDMGTPFLKIDPYARRFEMRPNTASRTEAESQFVWSDQAWLARRNQQDWLHAPLAIYELHLGSWKKGDKGHFLNYRELADQIVPYVKNLGFNAIQLLPLTEHPLDESWGYQVTGYFAASSRYGTPDDLRYFINQCHQHQLRVFLDWVPAHFPKDEHALARFDGSAVYEHEDPRRGEHRDWGTLIFNYGRTEVKNFLLSSAYFWLEEFHVDGLRVDAVASMLYLDYSRNANDWLPNIYGGNENLEAIAFLRELNTVLHREHPGCLIMAEESTAWPQVSRPVYVGGLGFSMKWNMGWMNDTLRYFSQDPVYRQYHHDQLTFGLLYAFSENFILPFSHDEVVHGKRSLLSKMPGDEWQRFANLRLLFCYMYTQPGKKLLFMGGEFAQINEWDHRRSLAWELLESDYHRGIQILIKDLNHLYQDEAALHHFDFEQAGFKWI
ncbi:MAG TPA: 1,4-alpha-glucan branching protein GlgB, partial [Pseudomonadales bacterium]|nr:1,4-alpha-glucan branching protein GlgB [Pseudomonadales bacterium]